MRDIEISRVELDNGAVLVRTRGDLDEYTAPKWRQFVREVVEDAQVRHLGLDLAGVHFFESTALGCLVFNYRKFREAGGESPGVFALIGLEPKVAKVFEITGLQRVFTIVASQEAFERLAVDHERQAEAAGSNVEMGCA